MDKNKVEFYLPNDESGIITYHKDVIEKYKLYFLGENKMSAIDLDDSTGLAIRLNNSVWKRISASEAALYL